MKETKRHKLAVTECPSHRMKVTAEHVFSNAHGTVIRRDHTIGHKTSVSQFKKTKITPTILSNHNDMKIELNERKAGKSTNKCEN